jgi:hypothetical protein
VVLTPDELVEGALRRETALAAMVADRSETEGVVARIGDTPATGGTPSGASVNEMTDCSTAVSPLTMNYEQWSDNAGISAAIAGMSPEKRKQQYVSSFVQAWNATLGRDLLKDYSAEFIGELLDTHGVPVVRGLDDSGWTVSRVQSLRSRLNAHPRKASRGTDAA